MKKKLKEKDFIKELRKFYHNQGSLTFKINERFTSGFPDLIVIDKNNGIMFIETKIGNNKLTPLQLETLRAIHHNGGKVFVVTKTEDNREVWEALSSNGELFKKEEK